LQIFLLDLFFQNVLFCGNFVQKQRKDFKNEVLLDYNCKRHFYAANPYQHKRSGTLGENGCVLGFKGRLLNNTILNSI